MQPWNEKAGRFLKEVGSSFLKEIAFGVVLWFLITTAVGEARMIPSESMEPTIHVGDRLWTDKLLLRLGEVQRGDIVVFDPPFASEELYIKRVIGLPGDEVAVKGGQVYINGEPLTESYVAEVATEPYGPVQVPAGHYLVMGDNRNHSYDSRWWGMLSADRVQSRAVFRIWPLARVGPVK